MTLKRKVLLGLGVAGIAGLFALHHLLVAFPHTPGPGVGQMREVVVPAGVGPAQLSAILAEAGVIASGTRFAWWLRATGGLVRIKAGRFLVSDRAAPVDIVGILSGPGTDLGIRVTIPEGVTLRRIGDILEQRGIVQKQKFLARATHASLLADLGIPGPTAEGYLFPDTYYFNPQDSADAVINTMHATLKARLTDAGSVPPPSDLKKILTLASIVQAEAQVADEMPIIAGVYANRLSDPAFPSRLLQADPTVAYGCDPIVLPQAPSCENFRGRLTRSHLDDPGNAYNTYKHPGLPPGPICAPGLSAIKAAIAPANVPYFYFVVQSKGRHTFSRTLKEHQRAVERYYRSRQGG
ncbi:MAG: endolytic transglycosylase MltG [Myxococcota bacterium]|nr:endolytic transglycosylase MltG [Myxococcota bacterium]